MDISILCFTYNHEKYIRKTLDGFLMQKGEFEYEILIHDDASTDGTIEILKAYKKKYPDKITLILEDENQYSQGIKILIPYLAPLIKGRYVAFCEGDDAWIYDKKIKRQFDWMESHPDTSMCIHNAIRINPDENEIVPQIFDMDSGYVEDEEVIWCKHGRIPTASFFFRSEYIKRFLTYADIVPVSDDPLRYLCANYGRIYYMDKVWSVRTYMHAGSWNKTMKENESFRMEHYKQYLQFDVKFNKETKGRFEEHLKKRSIILCRNLLSGVPVEELSCKELEEMISTWKEQEDHLLDDTFTRFRVIQMPKCKDYLEAAKKKVKCLQRNRQKVYIYGAGAIAKERAKLLMENNIGFQGFVISDKKENEDKCMGYQIYGIRELLESDRNIYLWLCMNDTNRKEVIDLLLSSGLKNIL